MAGDLQRYIHHLHLLGAEDTDPKIIKVLLADKQVVKCVCEVALNVLRGRVDLSPDEKQNLHKYRKLLYKLCDKDCTFARKKQALVQTGSGFLPALLIPALSFLASLF